MTGGDRPAVDPGGRWARLSGAWRAIGCGVLVVASVVSCGGDDSPAADAASTHTTDTTEDEAEAACDLPPPDASSPSVTAGPTTMPPLAPLPTVDVDPAEGRTPIPGFGEVSAAVVERPDGAPPVALCLLSATTAEQRTRGLMGIVDPALGGYDGMLFTHDDERPAGSGYWMKNTPLPLSLTYLDENGSAVDAAELEPCPPESVDCPSYPSSAPYRMVIEVVRGREPADLVVGSPARLEVRD